MKKLLALVPFFLFAACGDISFSTEPCDANAGEGGTGGTGGGTQSGSSSGSSAQCVNCFGDTRDGTRLRSQWINGADGSKIRNGDLWKDTQFNDELCSFTTLPSSETRCLPKHEVHNSFADSNCTVPLYLHKSGCGVPPKFIRVDTPDNVIAGEKCAPLIGDSQLYTVENEIPPLNMVRYREVDGTCGGMSFPAGAKLYAVTPAPEMVFFVSAQVGDGV